jgi:hypothetical protein
MLAFAVVCGGAVSVGVSRASESATPDDGVLLEGQSLTLKAEVEGGVAPFRYLWFKDFSPIPGAVAPELRFESLRLSDAGQYWVTVFNDGGSTTSAIETLVVRSGEPGRLANVSIVGSANDRIVVGFTLGGAGRSGSTAVLARAAGPALAQFGVRGALADPVLTVFEQGRLVSTNDDWGGDALLSAASNAVGAFPFLAASKDAAVVLSLPRSSYSAEVVDGGKGTGVTVVELYDTPDAANHVTPRLVNVSARGATGASEPTLTAGFTIQGEGGVKVLLRGIGPALERFGVTGVLANPRVVLFRGEALIASNDNWSEVDAGAIEAAQTAVGAFALGEKSQDAAVVILMSPGSYSAQVSSTSGSGMALIEVYEVP